MRLFLDERPTLADLLRERCTRGPISDFGATVLVALERAGG
jgi:hypothetical protein